MRLLSGTFDEEFPGQRSFFDRLVNVCYSYDDDSFQNFIMLREISFDNRFNKYNHNINTQQINDLFQIPKLDLTSNIKNSLMGEVAMNELISKVGIGILTMYRVLYLFDHFSNVCDTDKMKDCGFKSMEYVLNSLVGYLSSGGHLWFPKSFFSVVNMLFRFGSKVDISCKSDKQTGERTYDNVTSSLTTIFRLAIQDHLQPGNSGLRSLLLPVSNLILKLYFKCSNIRLCKSIISSLTALGKLENCRVYDVISFRYYAGKLAVYEGDYKNADGYLSEAFDKCPSDYKKITRAILKVLIPVKFMSGKVPSLWLLKTYRLEHFIPFSVSLRTGNIKAYRNAIKSQINDIIENGLFTLFCKMELLVSRTLCYHVYNIMGTSQLKLDVLLSAFSLSLNKPADLCKIMNILCNLIQEHYLRGYISYQYQVLVCSKKLAFPPIG